MLMLLECLAKELRAKEVLNTRNKKTLKILSLELKTLRLLAIIVEIRTEQLTHV